MMAFAIKLWRCGHPEEKGFKICSLFRKPTTDDSWKPVTTIDLLGMEYLDINPNRGMKAGYRALDRIQFTRVRNMKNYENMF
jgi:hypothetical protein